MALGDTTRSLRQAFIVWFAVVLESDSYGVKEQQS
jgi:hypothetical protein